MVKVIALYDKMLSAARGYIEDEELAGLLFDYESFLQEHKQYNLAESILNETIGICRRLSEKYPERAKFVAVALNDLALLHTETNHLELADREYESALEIYYKCNERGTNIINDDIADTLGNQGMLYFKQFRFEEAERKYEESLKNRCEPDGQGDEFIVNKAITLMNLGLCHLYMGKYDEAKNETEEALRYFRGQCETDKKMHLPYVAMSLVNLALIHIATKRYEEAENECEEALRIYGDLCEHDPDAFLSGVAQTLRVRAALYFVTNKFNQGEEGIKQVLKIYRNLSEQNPDAYMPCIMDALYYLACCQFKQDKIDDAICTIDKLITMDANRANWYDSRGEFLLAAGRTDEALAMWLKTIEIDPDFLEHCQSSVLYDKLKELGLVE